MKSQIKNLVFPLIWELLFIIFVIIAPFKTIYVLFVFYLVLIVYFAKDFSFKDFFTGFKDIKKFWIPVALTIVGMQLAHMVNENLIGPAFVDAVDGIYHSTQDNSYIGEVCHAITLLFLLPVGEELFFRKAIMNFDSALTAIASFSLGLVLCGFTYACLPLGVVEYMVLSLPLAVAFFCTRNIYVPITVHMVFMAYQNLEGIIYDFARLSMR